ncbi:DUF4394 domain-containing protein [Aquariibacter lacus]|uniref:DUF4394 domain-containing protein n=1 Tax=Aquariibacter lacus TaxID=2801332 RepID=UPI002573766E|nr:DUF4394 domain-containing protein [Piscinibacter lacus]
MHRFAVKALAAAALATLGLGAQAQSQTLVALTTTNEIVKFNTAGSTQTVAISGLASGETLLGLDTRPTNGLTYAISNQNNLYTIDTTSGALSLVTALSGASFASTGGLGMDFNPQADFAGGASLRVTTAGGNNYAVNVNTGVVGNTASNIGPGYTAVAYTNSFPGTPPGSFPGTMPGDLTDLYYINTSTDTLQFAGAAFNSPMITTVGSLDLPFNVLSANGFEIVGGGPAFAVLNLDDGTGASGLYSINLATGDAVLRSNFAGTVNGLAFTTAPVPEPETYALMIAGLGVVAYIGRRRKAKKA